MKLIVINLVLLLTYLLTLTTSAPSPTQDSQQPIILSQPQHERPNLKPKIPPNPKIRNATLSDIPSIAKTYKDAFRAHQEWHYIYQFADQHPRYHEYCLREPIRQIMEETTWNGRGVIKVIAVPDGDYAEQVEKVVSFAFWQFVDEATTADVRAQSIFPFIRHFDNPRDNSRSNLRSRLPPTTIADTIPFDCSLHLDLNQTRLHSVLSKESAARTNYLSPHYPNQLYLAVLATHPDHDGHGYAAAQVRLGLQWARQRGIPATLLATPAGYPVYKGVGFKSIENVTIGFLDGLGGTWEEVMVWEDKK